MSTISTRTSRTSAAAARDTTAAGDGPTKPTDRNARETNRAIQKAVKEALPGLLAGAVEEAVEKVIGQWRIEVDSNNSELRDQLEGLLNRMLALEQDKENRESMVVVADTEDKRGTYKTMEGMRANLKSDIKIKMMGYVEKLHQNGIRICPMSSTEFPSVVLSFQKHTLLNEDPTWQSETRPMLAKMMDKMLKKRMDNHKSNYRAALKVWFGE